MFSLFSRLPQTITIKILAIGIAVCTVNSVHARHSQPVLNAIEASRVGNATKGQCRRRSILDGHRGSAPFKNVNRKTICKNELGLPLSDGCPLESN